MGTYINPGNIGFDEINVEDYVDKTMLLLPQLNLAVNIC